MQLRPATAADLPRLRELEQAIIEAERPLNEAIKPNKTQYYDLPYLVSDSNSYLIVAEDQSTLIATGYIQIRPSKEAFVHDRHGYLGFMYVCPEYRGQGVNQRVLETLIDWAKQHQIRYFYLDVYTNNRAAIRAYEKMGFKPNLVEMKMMLNSERA